MNSYKVRTKQRSRQFFFNEIKKARLPKIDHVLCLPGPEAIEIGIYDRLGISRDKITCLESDRQSFCLLRKNPAALGCEILNLSFEDYVARKRKFEDSVHFDIVSLDFTCHIASQMDAMFDFFYRDFISSDSVVMTNFSGSREKAASQEIYSSFSKRLSRSGVGEVVDIRVGLSGALNFLVTESYGRGIVDLESSSLKSLDEFTGEDLTEYPNKFLAGVAIKGLVSQFGGVAIKEILDQTLSSLIAGGVRLMMQVQERYCRRGVYRHAAVRYIAGKTPMLMDVMHVKLPMHHPHLSPLDKIYWEHRRCPSIYELASFPGNLLALQGEVLPQHPTPHRVNLGSETELSKRAPITPPILELKGSALAMLRSGKSVHETALALGVPRETKRIAAWKAHLTMGSYEGTGG